MNKLIYPEKDFQELFTDLHASGLFADGKEISDAICHEQPEVILATYRREKNQEGFDLMAFYNRFFEKAPAREVNYVSDTTAPVEDHINKLWDILARVPEPEDFHSSRIPLPYPYIVPGGRFNEIYYWDSFFTMLGLQESGRVDMIEDMVKNFAHMIKEIGFIPNGNRSYFLGRSQPPFFACMINLLAESKGEQVLTEYLETLLLEYQFWMHGRNDLSPESPAYRRLVRMPDGSVLNRYFDNIPDPRAEMYQDDVELIAEKGDEGRKTLLDIRAACESGWDFSSRWCADPGSLESIITTDMVQVDLNCLLYFMEKLIAKAYALQGEATQANHFEAEAEARAGAILKYFWNDELGTFTDYLWIEGKQTDSINAAACFPLYFGIATEAQGQKVADISSKELVKDGGILTSNYESGQQWDYPNGWAPLQWIAIEGFRQYGQNALAETIKANWTALNIKVFKNTGKLMEKYNVVDTNLLSGGGEYPVQDGFGWTNGVLLKLLSE